MSRAKSKAGRLDFRFIAFPTFILATHEYWRLTHAAKSLLLAIAAQYCGHNNGRLVATPKYLSKFGWRSADTIFEGVRQLLQSGLLVQTRIGMRPNRAAWYALSWRPLNQVTEIEIDPRAFRQFVGTSLTP